MRANRMEIEHQYAATAMRLFLRVNHNKKTGIDFQQKRPMAILVIGHKGLPKQTH